MECLPLLQKLLDCLKKIVVLQGGGDAGKTVTILQRLALAAIREPNSVITVVAEDVPNIKAGVLRTFKKYVSVDPEIAPYISAYNQTERVFTFHGGSLIEFKSFEDEQDARGSERDYLFINECNSQTFNIFWQLQRKTRKQVFLDYNPTMRFWVHSKLLDKDTRDGQFEGKVQLYITDHRHNTFLSKEDHDAYESITDPDQHAVFARGRTGRVNGSIFNMKEVQAIPEGLPFGFGIDLGYNQDPSCIVKVWYDKKDRYYQVLLYMTENEILDLIIEQKLDLTPAGYMAKILRDNGCTMQTLVWGDHDKVYKTAFLRNRIPYRMAKKGPNSVRASISAVKKYNNYYYNSPIIKTELNTYVWEKAIDVLTGKEVFTNEPVEGVPDHAMAAIRYFNYSYNRRYAEKKAQEEDNETPAEDDLESDD